MKTCRCGCGRVVSGKTHFGVLRRFVTGHNLRVLKRTDAHCKAIAQAQRNAWKTKRHRLPIGTKRLDCHGYILVKVLPGKGAWKKEHIAVIEHILGRRLRSSELVHHINGDRADNRSENLYLCRDQSHHNSIHRSEMIAFRVLLKEGMILFRDGHYEAILRTS